MADCLETDATTATRSTPLGASWKDWAARKGEPVGKMQDVWDRLSSRYKHDANNGRPRYHGVKVREAVVVRGPKLAVNND
jgi:hypothetical protein